MNVESWTGRRVVVVGAGRSGVAVAELLVDRGAEVVLTDAREAAALPYLDRLSDPRVRLQLGGHPDELWQGVDVVVVSPGIPETSAVMSAARATGAEITSEIEVASRWAAAPCAAITGSNGKSTVTSMVGAILERAGQHPAVAGNIGTPFSRVVLEALRGQREVGRYVLELSSFQTESVLRFHPRWSAVLNISADHLDRHRTLDEYAWSKLRLLRNCTEADFVVYGAEDPWLSAHLPRDGAVPVPFRTAAPANGGPQAWVTDEAIYWRDPAGETVRVVGNGELRVVGHHNLLNAAAAVALSCLAGARPGDCAGALREFRGLEHRMEPCGDPLGVHCINDSKATNVGATAASLRGLAAPTWLILGGRDKDSDFNELRPLLQGRTRAVLLIGEATGRIAASLRGAAPLIPCGSMERAVEIALEGASPGEVLLLAPACTSFDQYDDFEHRGRHFKALIAARTAAAAAATRS